MESQRLREWRLRYLTALKQFREENRPIIYLDETWFDTHDTPRKGWNDSSKKCQTKAPSHPSRLNPRRCYIRSYWIVQVI